MSFKEVIQRAIKRKQEADVQKTELPSDEEIGEKILFTGLDNSGKTSIILALQNKYSRIATLQPTRQTERSSFSYLGNRITRWDLGGQQRYRIAYLKNPGKYFDKTAICVYVIDVQDKERVDEAVEYFQKVVAMFKQLAIAPPIYIFLHKADPEWMRAAEDYQAGYVETLEDKFRKSAPDHQMLFQITSIFDPWTIISSFSEVLLHLYPKSELVDRSIEEFAKKLKAEGMVVLDNNALILGQYFTDVDQKQDFEDVTPYVLQLFENFRSIQKKNKKLAITLDEGEYMFHVVTDPLQSDERFIFVKAPLSGITESDIDDFGNILIDLLSKK